MNEAFFALPDEKRMTIINAGLRVFSKHGYKKSPMKEIAAEAGISKSLLFYYFKNKKELYLYLAKYCADINREELISHSCYQGSFFDVLKKGLKLKTEQMRRYPELAQFELKGYFEKNPEIEAEIRELIQFYSGLDKQANLMTVDMNEFIEGLDIEMMYQTIFPAAEGYVWETLCKIEVDPDAIERGCMKMIDFWKDTFLRKNTEP